MSTDTGEKATVYLDHLIGRESLRYQRRNSAGVVYTKQNPPLLPLSELVREGTLGEPTSMSFLRKPDFQRATLSWTASDCVLLLQSLVERLVVPSIILWTNSSSSLRYILDGSHRISVVKAWLLNDWGDEVASKVAEDEEQEEGFITAAKAVRAKLQNSIGLFSSYKAAYEEKSRHLESDNDPEHLMAPHDYKKATFYEDYISLQIAFPLLWVEGGYDIAEMSFLRINQGGKSLTPWEARIVTYRNSSAMRLIMSVCSTASAEHYWPKVTASDDNQMIDITAIHEGIKQLRSAVFTPTPKRPFVPDRHPIIGGLGQDKKQDYLGELLCILKKGKGTDSEIRNLLDIDSSDMSQNKIVSNGRKLLSDSLDSLSHFVDLSATSSKYQNASLDIVPLLYFYQETGLYISSLVYGFMYWILNGTPSDILARKRLFSAFRKSFERILFLRKNDVVSNLSRNIGSGSDATFQTALYFNHLLDSLIKHKGDIESVDFQQDYLAFTKQLLKKEGSTSFELLDIQSNGRVFSARQKAVKAYRLHFQHHTPCEICGGFKDLTTPAQHDHKVDYAHGGKTNTNNQQIAHPFCNTPETKRLTQLVKNGHTVNIALPSFR